MDPSLYARSLLWKSQANHDDTISHSLSNGCQVCKELLFTMIGGPAARDVSIWGPERMCFVAHNDCIEQCEQLVSTRCRELYDRRIISLTIAVPYWRTVLCEDVVVQIVGAFIGAESIRFHVLKDMSGQA
jgi:hypothetical protein